MPYFGVYRPAFYDLLRSFSKASNRLRCVRFLVDSGAYRVTIRIELHPGIQPHATEDCMQRIQSWLHDAEISY